MLPILTTSQYTFLFKRLGECTSELGSGRVNNITLARIVVISKELANGYTSVSLKISRLQYHAQCCTECPGPEPHLDRPPWSPARSQQLPQTPR